MALLAASGLCSAVGLLTGAGVALKWGNDSARRARKLRGLLQPRNLSGVCCCAGRFALVVPRLAGQCTLVLSNFHSVARAVVVQLPPACHTVTVSPPSIRLQSCGPSFTPLPSMQPFGGARVVRSR